MKIYNVKKGTSRWSSDSDIKQRTLSFSKEIVHLVSQLPKKSVNFVLGKQAVRSGTSIGANVREADNAYSTRDFCYKLSIARNEAKETKYWLKLILEANPELEEKVEPLLKETEELIKILSTIILKTRKRQKDENT